ncbi:hypothetical protein HLRTI_000471 [Halorhabdus tiamatea SARL4B]|uniref:Uncharacterized protein n=1 Tax=Halorhabdus tiamatea SARL4B TaxID=1033806 RepID=F7PLN7_9EURY|nr:hypothetical protein [Halorhabdus tiamatea]ERJ07429.1 hypothetical protein HLRTI_000471 [Halorhabdus tiamatea SARL4B]
MATTHDTASGEAARIDERTIDDALLIRYEDGDITIAEDGEGADLGGQIVLAPSQLATLTRQWPLETESPLYLGVDELGREGAVERLDTDVVVIENTDDEIGIAAETVASIVKQLDFWNYDQYVSGSADRVELDGDHVQGLLEFAWNNHPRDGIGWTGDFAEALVEAETALYDRVIELPREPLETVVEAVEDDDESAVRESKQLREVKHRLHAFGVDRIAVNRNYVKSLFEDAKEDGAADETEVAEAIDEIQGRLDV